MVPRLPPNIKIEVGDRYLLLSSDWRNTFMLKHVLCAIFPDRNSLLSKIDWNLLNDHKLVYKNNCLVVLWWWLSARAIWFIWYLCNIRNSDSDTSEESEFLICPDWSEPVTKASIAVQSGSLQDNSVKQMVWHLRWLREEQVGWQYLWLIVSLMINEQQRINREVSGGNPGGKIAAIN